MSTTTTTNTNYKAPAVSRTFQFVPYGRSLTTTTTSSSTSNVESSSPSSNNKRATISCDGRIAGTTLELSHWNGNDTPDMFYADLSTEMALKLPMDMFPDAIVVNNHYDTDGVLSVYACLHPDQITFLSSTIQQQQQQERVEELLVSAAAAGDFGEWNSDAGVKLDAVLTNIMSVGHADSKNDKEEQQSQEEEQACYQRALEELPNILQDFIHNNGESYKYAWQETYNHAVQSYEYFQTGQARMEMMNGIVIVYEPPGQTTTTTTTTTTCTISPFALHRAMVEQQRQDQIGVSFWQSATRILRVVQQHHDSNVFQYVYEKPGHGWVNKLKTRRPIPPVADCDQLIASLNQAMHGEEQVNCWKRGGPSDLISICCTSSDVTMPPTQVAAILCQLDEGAAAVDFK